MWLCVCVHVHVHVRACCSKMIRALYIDNITLYAAIMSKMSVLLCTEALSAPKVYLYALCAAKCKCNS